ncbi:MAG: hypothetical protein R3C68_12900 [Myxococcota bacterium]
MRFVARTSSRAVWVMLGLCTCPLPVRAQWSSKGEVAIEGRAFLPDNEALTVDQDVGLFGRVEVLHKHENIFREKVRIFGRVDRRDEGRSVLIVEEAWVELKKSLVRLRLGADIVNWTATEAFHPADVLNSRNLDSDVENFEKVGEPMAELSFNVGNGTLSAYYMPYYTRPIQPSPRSRQGVFPPGLPVGPLLRMDAHGNLADGDFGHQGGLRARQTFGSADLSLHFIHHMDRDQPEIVFDATAGELRPLFRTVTQAGGTYQQVFGSLILKVEAAYRFRSLRRHDSAFGFARRSESRADCGRRGVRLVA